METALTIIVLLIKDIPAELLYFASLNAPSALDSWLVTTTSTQNFGLYSSVLQPQPSCILLAGPRSLSYTLSVSNTSCFSPFLL